MLQFLNSGHTTSKGFIFISRAWFFLFCCTKQKLKKNVGCLKSYVKVVQFPLSCLKLTARCSDGHLMGKTVLQLALEIGSKEVRRKKRRKSFEPFSEAKNIKVLQQ
ncbi:uncharacterized protein LOC108116714 [Drosophila eugracilis]|uniref:uncharacterized protein LOC108116714 n=1 Tax=Drosophila eugracilis TaxID=29029 RepID=UPI001BD9AAAB|nr:uncharacterized protein LOC108116714 [Drosophila eugracilis]